MTGNGDFDGITDFGESFVKLKYDTSGVSPSLTLTDSWTPWTNALRTTGQAAPAVADPMPTNFRSFSMGDGFDPSDMDLGSGAPVLAANAGAVVGAGKDGILYVVNQSQMGKTAQADLADVAKSEANYHPKLKSPPIFFTYFPGLDKNPAPGVYGSLTRLSTVTSTTEAIISMEARCTGTAPIWERCCTAGARTATYAPGRSPTPVP